MDTAPALIKRLGAQAMITCPLESQALKDELLTLTGVTSVRQTEERYIIYTNSMQSTLMALLAYVEQRSIVMEDLQMGIPTLEDVFLELTGRQLRDA